MTRTRIKKIVTRKGQVQYFLGDGLWFGRISKKQAEDGLATEKYILWETINK